MAFISIGCIIYDTKDNWNTHIVNKKSKKTVEQNSTHNSEENNTKEDNEKSKLLDELWEKGFNAFNKENDCEGCIEIMNNIILKDGNYYKAYALKGIALCYLKPEGKFDEGMKNINESLSINPDYGYGRFCKALAYELFGKYNDAIDAYNSALQAEKYVWSYYGLASIYGRMGNVDKAVEYLKIATTMNSQEDNQIIKDDAKKEADFDNVRNSSEFQALLK